MGDRWKRLAPLSGVLMVAAIVASFAVSGETPNTDDSAAKIVHFYSTHQGRAQVGLALMLYAALFAVVYYVSVARFLRRRGADVLAEIAVVGGAIFAAGLCLGGGTIAVLTDNFHSLSSDPTLVRTLNVISEDLWWPMAMVGFTIATLALGISMLRTRALPKALGIVTVIVGVGGLTGIGTWWAFLASGLLTLFIGGYAYRAMGQQEEASMPDVPSQREVADVPSRETTST